MQPELQAIDLRALDCELIGAAKTCRARAPQPAPPLQCPRHRAQPKHALVQHTHPDRHQAPHDSLESLATTLATDVVLAVVPIVLGSHTPACAAQFAGVVLNLADVLHLEQLLEHVQ